MILTFHHKYVPSKQVAIYYEFIIEKYVLEFQSTHTGSVLSDDMESNLSPHETSTRHHRKNANTHGRIEMTLPCLYSEFSSYVISAVLMFSFGQEIT